MATVVDAVRHCLPGDWGYFRYAYQTGADGGGGKRITPSGIDVRRDADIALAFDGSGFIKQWQ
ncbi:hypothetical protein YERSI8AC_200085 [Enterobacterales bacterium 8AC]|nr:hypothetical protein YERSI8AC_200085 [Enterobacterales bacterium 8AC]